MIYDEETKRYYFTEFHMNNCKATDGRRSQLLKWVDSQKQIKKWKNLVFKPCPRLLWQAIVK